MPIQSLNGLTPGLLQFRLFRGPPNCLKSRSFLGICPWTLSGDLQRSACFKLGGRSFEPHKIVLQNIFRPWLDFLLAPLLTPTFSNNVCCIRKLLTPYETATLTLTHSTITSKLPQCNSFLNNVSLTNLPSFNEIKTLLSS